MWVFHKEEERQVSSYHGEIPAKYVAKIRVVQQLVGDGKIVIWGLRNEHDTFRYIFSSFYVTLKKLGIPVLWTDNRSSNNTYVNDGDIVIVANVAGSELDIKDNVRYCLHNMVGKPTASKDIIHLQVYTDQAINENVEYWNETTLFDRQIRTLYQPWGTNLLPWEFLPPVFSPSNKVYWIGSIWNNEFNQGNLDVINELKKALSKHKLTFVHKQRISDHRNIYCVRTSRIAPAFGGLWQVKQNYMPCRVFKNISYGQLGITNVSRFKDVLGDAYIDGNSIEELIDSGLSLSEKKYKEIIHAQQQRIAHHSYLDKIANILVAFEH
jgi:hypothetical protein